MKGIYRFCFLLSSFAPLFALLAVKVGLGKGWDHWLMWLAFAVALVALLSLFVVVRGFRRSGIANHAVSDVRARDTETMSYLMAYIPLLIFRDVTVIEVGVPLVVLYAMIFLIYYLLEAPFVNPCLAAMGYRLYEARMVKGKQLVIVFANRKKRLVEGQVKLREIANSSVYYLEND